MSISKVILQTVAPRYRPDDVYIGNLFGSLGAINAGITTMLDWSHIMLTPEHADAAVKGLADSGIRGVFAHGDPVAPFVDWWSPKSELRHPADARRVRRQYFSSDDQLLTMALALRGPEYSSWDASVDDLKLARDLGLPITIHMGVPGAKPGAVKALYEAKLLGPDITHVHTLRCSDEELQMIGDSGGSVSTSSATELMSGHGFPSLQRWLRHGIRPSLSIDNETRMPTDLFTQMRALLMIDRLLETQRVIKEGGKPILVPVRDVLELATIQGARTLGLDRKTGSLTPGKQADIIMVNLDDINVMPVNDAVSSAVTICNASNVSWVMIDGKVRKRDGKLVGVDIERSRQLMAQSHAFLTRGLDQGGGVEGGVNAAEILRRPENVRQPATRQISGIRDAEPRREADALVKPAAYRAARPFTRNTAIEQDLATDFCAGDSALTCNNILRSKKISIGFCTASLTLRPMSLPSCTTSSQVSLSD